MHRWLVLWSVGCFGVYNIQYTYISVSLQPYCIHTFYVCCILPGSLKRKQPSEKKMQSLHPTKESKSNSNNNNKFTNKINKYKGKIIHTTYVLCSIYTATQLYIAYAVLCVYVLCLCYVWMPYTICIFVQSINAVHCRCLGFQI